MSEQAVVRSVQEGDANAFAVLYRRYLDRIYPLEKAVQVMQQMRREEPDDDCGLQESLVYEDPEDGYRAYLSWDIIHDVVQRKANQIQTLRAWLGQFVPGRSSALGECPGIVDWPGQSEKLARLRDSGPQGLSLANQRCRDIREGDDHNLYEGLWSLKKAWEALSRDEMMKYLRETIEGIDP